MFSTRRVDTESAAAFLEINKEFKSTGEATTKVKVAIVIGFVGSKYHGLQYINPSVHLNPATNMPYQTIEGLLADALFKCKAILPSNHMELKKLSWSSSSRTDKGVHCCKMVISLKIEAAPTHHSSQSSAAASLGLQKLKDKLNAVLPPDIRVFGLRRVNNSFRARNCANFRYQSKRYQYHSPIVIITIIII